jgi:hypothetical protein
MRISRFGATRRKLGKAICAIALTSAWAAFLYPATAPAATLFSFSTYEGGSQPGTVSDLTFPIQFSGNTTYLTNSVFAGDEFTAADVGKVVTITATSDPNYLAFVNELTDGRPESMIFWFVPAPATNISGQGWNEQSVVWGDPTDPRVDLHGYTVRSLSLELDALTISNQGSSSSFNATITFSGSDTVPEPPRGGILSAAALLLLMRPRRFLVSRLTCS